MKRLNAILTVVSLFWLLAWGLPAAAADFGLGLRAGTHGAGVEGGVSATEFLTIRASVSALSIDESFDEGGINYDGELEVGGVGVLADFFPMRGTFRLTAGLFSNDNEITFLATPTQPEEIGGVTYTPAEIGTLSGAVDFNETVPYFGVGWGNVATGKRLGFLCDLGVLGQGSGDVTLSASSPLVNQADLDAEAREIEDDIDGYDLWPVISFGMAIRF